LEQQEGELMDSTFFFYMTGVGAIPLIYLKTLIHIHSTPQQKPWDSCQEMIRMNQMNAESSD